MATPNPSTAFAGFLPPADSPSPKYGEALEDVFHDTIAGITGIAGKFVRPRWQADPPDQPAFDVNWCAFGITRGKKDWNPFMHHVPLANLEYGADELMRNEELSVLFSFYGPNANALQSRFEDGIMIEQNRAVLNAAGIVWISMDDWLQVPALMQEKWLKRIDQRMLFKRNVVRQYPVLNLDGADMGLDNEYYITDISVNPPTP